MYSYTICNMPDKELFKKQCKALEINIPNIQKGKLLEDFDGSETQIYSLNGKKVTVHNSFYIGSLVVKSECDLLPYFDK